MVCFHVYPLKGEGSELIPDFNPGKLPEKEGEGEVFVLMGNKSHEVLSP